MELTEAGTAAHVLTPQERTVSDAALLELYHFQAISGRLANLAQCLRGYGLPLAASTDDDDDVLLNFAVEGTNKAVDLGLAQLSEREDITEPRHYLYLACLEIQGPGKYRVYWSWTSSHGLLWEAPENATVAYRNLDTNALTRSVAHFWRTT